MPFWERLSNRQRGTIEILFALRAFIDHFCLLTTSIALICSNKRNPQWCTSMGCGQGRRLPCKTVSGFISWCSADDADWSHGVEAGCSPTTLWKPYNSIVGLFFDVAHESSQPLVAVIHVHNICMLAEVFCAWSRINLQWGGGESGIRSHTLEHSLDFRT